MTKTRKEEAGSRPVRALTLELTKGCNLRCAYCYYADREDAYQPSTRMSTEVAEQSVDLLLDQCPPDQTPHLHFFGGEPLLHVDLLHHTVAYAERRGAETGRQFTYEITTNGTRLTDEVIEFLNEHEVQVGVSYDGPPEVQDAARPAAGGSSSSMAVPGIRRLLESRKGTPLAAKTHCSVVVTRAEPDLVRIVEYLEDLGFHHVLLTPATDLEGRNNGFRDEDLPELLRQYDRLAEDYETRVREGREPVARYYELLMNRLLSGEKKTKFCGGGQDYLGVGADGQLALCYRFYEDEEFSMGSVQDGVQRQVTQLLDEHELDTRTACGQCWARYFCGGGCHHDNLVRGGGLGDPDPVTCDVLRHGMGRTLEMWARLHREGRVADVPPAAVTEPVEAQEDQGEEEMSTQTPFASTDRPQRAASCHARELDGEKVVYHPESHDVVVLNASAAFIFDQCDGDRSVDDLLDAMANRYDADRELLHRDLLATLGMLRERRLLQA